MKTISKFLILVAPFCLGFGQVDAASITVATLDHVGLLKGEAFFSDGFESQIIPIPAISSVDYPVIAHGGKLVLTGINFTGVTEVTIGGVSHTDLNIDGGTSLTINEVLDATPIGAQGVVAIAGSESSAPFEATVIHLVINEIEADSPSTDNHEFVELSVQVESSVSLDGYVLVFLNGGSANGDRYRIYDLADGVVDGSNGLMLIGPTLLSKPPHIVEATVGFIQSGEDAIAIYQFAGDVASFPADYATAGNSGLIDAVIYESGSDTDRPVLQPLIESGGVFDEGATLAARETISIQRCSPASARRDGSAHIGEIPTPGSANIPCGGVTDLPDCTIDFTSGCPDTGSGQCGALFVAHAGNAQCHVIGVPACYGSGTSFHSFSPDQRIDIFLAGELDDLTTFLAPYQGTDATMRFFDINGSEVGTALTISDDCGDNMTPNPPSSNIANLGSGNVRRIQVTGDADIWIDDFRVNPP